MRVTVKVMNLGLKRFGVSPETYQHATLGTSTVELPNMLYQLQGTSM